MTRAAGSVEALVGDAVGKALEAFALPCRAEVRPRPSSPREPWTVLLHPEPGSPLPARRWTQVANALQTLLEAALAQAGRTDAVLVSLAEASGRPPPPREDEGLVAAAKALAALSARLDRPCALGPMNVADRRLVHQALGEVRGVWTQSEGEGIFRRLWMVPRSRMTAPAPEAAVRAPREPAPPSADRPDRDGGTDDAAT